MEDTLFQAPSTKRVERIEKIKRLFAWPTGLWFALMAASVVTTRIDYFNAFRSGLEVAVFYSLPVILFYIAGATFYSSYRILESRGYKNAAVFILVQCLAYFVGQVLGLEVPKFDRSTSVILTAAVAVGLLVVISIVQICIRLPKEGEESSVEPRLPGPGLGVVMSGLISALIASVIHFRVRDGISFVTWGVFFGALVSIIAFSAERNLLSLLFFLDPGGAANLFRIIKVKRDLENQKDLGEVERELTVLRKEQMSTKMRELANELDKHFTNAKFEEAQRRVQVMIDQLKDSAGQPLGDQQRILENVTAAIAQLREKETLPALPAPDYSTLSLGEKVHQLVGLSPEEIEEAVKENLIAAEQSHLWTVAAQVRLQMGLADFEKEDLWGQEPVFLARSWAAYAQTNKHVLQALTDAIIGETLQTCTVIGAEAWGISELTFSTVTKIFSAVLKKGANSALVVVGIVERPPQPHPPGKS